MKSEKYFCNGCGRKLHLEPSPREDVFTGYKEWGYFSEKDLRVDEFILCEQCYDKMVEQFAIPVKTSKKIEVLKEGKSFL